MITYILLAFLNGTVIGTSRAINGRLGAEVGSFKASLWNHLIGFLFLTPALLLLGGWKFDVIPAAPPSAYVGGFFGALFVAVSSYVFPRLGAMNAALLVISGQMISAVLIDYRNQGVPPTPTRCLGVVIVLLGVYLTRAASAARTKDKSP